MKLRRSRDPDVYADREVLELFAEEPELIAVVDALASARPRRPTKRFAIVLVTAAVLAGGGTALGVGIDLLTQQKHYHANVPDDPQRIGPLVQVTSGDSWALIAWRSTAGICLDFAVPNNAPYVCGLPVRDAKPTADTSGAGPPIHSVAGFVANGGLVGSDGKTTILGLATSDVASVEVELRNGAVLDASVYNSPADLETPLKVFIVRTALHEAHQSIPSPRQGLPAAKDPVRAYGAFDDNGNLIERVDVAKR